MQTRQNRGGTKNEDDNFMRFNATVGQLERLNRVVGPAESKLR